MSMQSERRIVSSMLRYLNDLPGGFFWKTNDRFTVGIPDIVGCYLGKFIAIEVKKPGEKPRKIQEYWISKIKESGGSAIWLDNLKELKEFMTNIQNS